MDMKTKKKSSEVAQLKPSDAGYLGTMIEAEAEQEYRKAPFRLQKVSL